MSRCTIFVRSASLPPTPTTNDHTLCKTALLHTCDLHSTCYATDAITADCIRTRCSSAVNIVDLRLYVLQNHVGTHCCPTFICATQLPLTSLTCVRTRCRALLIGTAVLHSYLLRVCRHYRWLHSSSAVNIVYLRSYALQNVIGTHRCPTLVRAACLPSTLSTCVRTHCRTSLVHTAVVHS